MIGKEASFVWDALSLTLQLGFQNAQNPCMEDLEDAPEKYSAARLERVAVTLDFILQGGPWLVSRGPSHCTASRRLMNLRFGMTWDAANVMHINCITS